MTAVNSSRYDYNNFRGLKDSKKYRDTNFIPWTNTPRNTNEYETERQ